MVVSARSCKDPKTTPSNTHTQQPQSPPARTPDGSVCVCVWRGGPLPFATTSTPSFLFPCNAPLSHSLCLVSGRQLQVLRTDAVSAAVGTAARPRQCGQRRARVRQPEGPSLRVCRHPGQHVHPPREDGRPRVLVTITPNRSSPASTHLPRYRLPHVTVSPIINFANVCGSNLIES